MTAPSKKPVRYAPRLQLRGVGRRFGARVALASVDLDIAPGQRVALAGPSGSGKSTLLRIMAGALRPTEGHIDVDGMRVGEGSARALRRYRASLGLVEQGSHLVPQLSVHRNVAAGWLPRWRWPTALASLVWPMRRAEVAELLGRVDLAERQWDRTATLSGGQQQRVAIARAIANRPTMILADEPTASLDPEAAAGVVRVLTDPAVSGGATLVMCTHWVSFVTGSMDRLVGVRDGRVVLDAPADSITERDLDDLYRDSRERR